MEADRGTASCSVGLVRVGTSSVYVYITGSIAHSPHLAEAELIQLEGAVGVLGRDCVAKAAAA